MLLLSTLAMNCVKCLFALLLLVWGQLEADAQGELVYKISLLQILLAVMVEEMCCRARENSCL